MMSRSHKATQGPVSEFARHNFRHFNAATLVDAADAYDRHLKNGGKMMVTLAGAMSTAEIGLSLAEMIRRDKVHAITCTGANLEEDVFNLVAHDHYERVPHYRVLMCHGSPRSINEFLWESATPTGLLRRFLGEAEADVLACTHTGIKWHRPLPDGKHAVNVGVIGRPENDGSSNVWYTVLTAGPDLSVEFVPVHYDFGTLARQIEQEGLPAEFAETVRSGWWTTCLENLPSKERSRGKF